MNTPTLKLTKIVATIGPSSDSPEIMRALVKNGVNVFRFNMKHADIAWHNDRVSIAQKIAEEEKTHLGILIDLQGPEIRIETPSKKDVPVKKNETLLFTREHSNNESTVCIPHPEVFDALQAGDQFSIDDGFQEFTVVERTEEGFMARANEDYVIKHRKGLNIVAKDIALPSLTEDDKKKLDMAAHNKVDFVALSFSRTKEDIEILRAEMLKRNIHAHIVAKIESQKGLDNLQDIIQASDCIMIARGDLGIEVPIEQLAHWQKTMIVECRAAYKPVITATQMLQSMVDNARPTRAEAVDVANAVFDGTDAVMLSGETAGGKFPVKSVQAMAKIAQYNELFAPEASAQATHGDTTNYIADAVVAILQDKKSHIDAIVVCTESGYTARVISSCRPKQPIFSITSQQKTADTLALSYGVHPMVMDIPENALLSMQPIAKQLKDRGYLHEGNTVLFVHGEHWREPGLTNALSIMTV